MTKRTTSAQNVWENIHLESSRRTSADAKYNFFWFCDINGRYGLLASFSKKLAEKDFAEKLRGLTIVKDSRDEQGDDLYLVLNDNSDWELFYTFCTDLLKVSEGSTSETELIKNLRRRLKRWQFFLSEGNSRSMPEPRQMGLLAELSCLKEILIPELNLKSAIISWVGPDFDRQDFSLENSFIEVKSFLSSKGAFVTISSLHQLVNNIKPLYLLTYGLSRNDSGTSIKQLAGDICIILEADSEECDLFEQKLAAYGYIDGLTEEPFYKYAKDSVKCYAVTEEFPKIVPGQVMSQIVAAQYTIDLTSCGGFEVEISSIFK